MSACKPVEIGIHKPNKDLLKVLIELFQEAKTSQIRSIFYVVEYDNGDAGSGFTVSDETAEHVRIIGELERLKFRLIEIENEREGL